MTGGFGLIVGLPQPSQISQAEEGHSGNSRINKSLCSGFFLHPFSLYWTRHFYVYCIIPRKPDIYSSGNQDKMLQFSLIKRDGTVNGSYGQRSSANGGSSPIE